MLGATLGNMASGMVSVPKTSLVFYEDWASPVAYPGATGTTVNDLSPSLLTGTLLGSTLPTFTQFTNGGYFTFNGTTAYISYGNNLNMGTNDRSLVCWFYVTSTPTTNTRHFFGKIAPGSVTAGRHSLAVTTGLKLQGLYSPSGVATNTFASVATLSLNTWYMGTLVIARSSGQQILYINGSVDRTDTITTESTNHTALAANLQLGAGSGPVQFFPGRLGFSLIYNKALSATEVANIYNYTKNRYA